MYRNRGLLFPLVLIAIGAVVLLANTGVLSTEALLRLGDLWPLLLVILGLQLILNHTLPRQQATLIGLAATVVIVIAALAYAALAPAAPFGTRQATSSQQLGGLTAATLDLNYNGATVDIQGASSAIRSTRPTLAILAATTRRQSVSTTRPARWRSATARASRPSASSVQRGGICWSR